MRVERIVVTWAQSALAGLKLAILIVVVSPTLAVAAEFGSQIEALPSRNAALAGSIQTDYLVEVVLSLLLVVGIILLLSFVLKKVNLQTRAGTSAIRIVSVVSLGAKDRLLLVEVGEEQLLLGSSPGSVQMLHTLSQRVESTASAESSVEKGNFMSVLNSVRRGQGT